MIQFNANYELNDIEKRRVRPLLNEVLERSISFKYFTTIVYHKRKTNYDHVLEDNRVFNKRWQMQGGGGSPLAQPVKPP